MNYRTITRRIPKATYANVMATIAVMLSLSGTAWAASKITSAQIKNNTITSKDVKNRSLAATDFKVAVVESWGDWGKDDIPDGWGFGWGSLGAEDLTGGPKEPTEEQKQKNYGANPAPLGKGVTLTGVWGGKGTPNDGALWPIALPASPLTEIPATQVVFGGAIAPAAGDSNATYCKGSYISPTAARGWLCIYVEPTTLTGVQTLSARPVTTTKLVYPGPTEAPDRTIAFIIEVAAANGANSVVAHGTWAYADPCSGCPY